MGAEKSSEEIKTPAVLAEGEIVGANVAAVKADDVPVKVRKTSDESVMSIAVPESTSKEDPAIAQPVKPLTIRKLEFQKKIRLPKLDGATKTLKQIEKDSALVGTSALKELDRVKSDVGKLIEKRNRESIKGLTRIKDSALRTKLETKLRAELEKTNKANDKYMDEQNKAMEKLVETAIGDYVKEALKLTEKAKEKQMTAFEDLTTLGPKIIDKVQKNFAALSKVMEEIAKAK